MKRGYFVKAWNKENPIGTLVTVTLDCGRVIESKTRAPAELLGGHTGVVWLEGIAGCYLLTRVKKKG